MLSLEATLQQMSGQVVLQVADAGISPSAQQQLHNLLLLRVTMETSCHVQSCVTMSLISKKEKKIQHVLDVYLNTEKVSCLHWTHFHVDKVFHSGQRKHQQITDQIRVPLLHSQVQHRLVTFYFLEFEKWKWRIK